VGAGAGAHTGAGAGLQHSAGAGLQVGLQAGLHAGAGQGAGAGHGAGHGAGQGAGAQLVSHPPQPWCERPRSRENSPQRRLSQPESQAVAQPPSQLDAPAETIAGAVSDTWAMPGASSAPAVQAVAIRNNAAFTVRTSRGDGWRGSVAAGGNPPREVPGPCLFGGFESSSPSRASTRVRTDAPRPEASEGAEACWITSVPTAPVL